MLGWQILCTWELCISRALQKIGTETCYPPSKYRVLTIDQVPPSAQSKTKTYIHEHMHEAHPHAHTHTYILIASIKCLGEFWFILGRNRAVCECTLHTYNIYMYTIYYVIHPKIPYKVCRYICMRAPQSHPSNHFVEHFPLFY